MPWQSRRFVFAGVLTALMLACGAPGSDESVAETPEADVDELAEVEVHLANLQQLTFGGENAEAYFSSDGSELIFQSTREGVPCDQIFRMGLDGSDLRMVSTGDGRTTCGYFYPDGESIIYASTHISGAECPPPPSFEMGYVWAIYDTYDIFRAAPDGSGLMQLTETPGYDAEATIGPNGRVVFTSVRDGDMEVYSMNGDGSDLRRLTTRQGPDVGPSSRPTARRSCFAAVRFLTVPSMTTTSGCSMRDCGARPSSRSS